MTNDEMENRFRWLSHPLIIIVIAMVFLLCIVSALAHA